MLEETVTIEEEETKPLKVVKRKKYSADPLVVKALKKSLDTCTEKEWTSGIVILFDKNTSDVFSYPVFQKDKDLFDCMEIAKHRYMSVSDDGADDDSDEK